ncbi:MAG TPA: hypothetical protein VMR41_01750 [Patescibacteria group bacterium]|nr:hypothetical protein [Patescibacteria group bacterium]
MHNLTQRQIDILKSIIEEYIDTAEPVGSETLEKKHNLSASPATIRNEMVQLSELGYLKKPHTSAGRVPTPAGMKLYVRELMKEKELSTVEEVAMKEKVWDYRDQEQRFLREVTKSLADKTKTLAIATNGEGTIFAAGYSYILDMPEFFDIDVTKNLLSTIDEYGYFQSLFTNTPQTEEDTYILVGEELGSKLDGPYGCVFTKYHTGLNHVGQIGVLGPVRLDYQEVVPTVRYFGNLIEELLK